MNINLVYEGKDYNFDIPNGVTIDYLKELSSKIFNSEKELLDLIYNNEKVAKNDSNTLIRDLIPEGETNAVLTVQINKSLKKNNNNQITPLVNLKQKNIQTIIKESDENVTTENKIIKKKKRKKTERKNPKEIIFDNKSEKIGNYRTNSNNNIFSNNINTNNYRTNNNSKVKLVFNGSKEKLSNYNLNNLIEKDINKKVLFESTYIKKNNELLSLIKEFNEKIKKIYLILYKKIKDAGLTSNNISNNISSFSNNNTSRSNINISISNNYYYELSLYEKKIINFLEREILYYKSLLEIMKKYDNNININKLSEFYNKLMIFNFIGNTNLNFEKLKPIKLTRVPSKNLINNNSSINLSTSINNKTDKLPFINKKTVNSPLKNSNSRNIIFNNNILSGNTTSNNNYNQLNESKENTKIKLNNINDIKNSKIKKNIDEENSFINNKINKISINKNSSNNNIQNNKSVISSEGNSLDSDKENTNKKINNKNSINDSINNINASPIKLQRRNSINTKKTPVRGSDIFISQNYEDKVLYRSSLKNMNKPKNDKRITIEDIRKNDNGNRIKKDVKIKEINVSNMTINDSNFAREKHMSPKKSRKNSLNKYDFLV